MQTKHVGMRTGCGGGEASASTGFTPGKAACREVDRPGGLGRTFAKGGRLAGAWLAVVWLAAALAGSGLVAHAEAKPKDGQRNEQRNEERNGEQDESSEATEKREGARGPWRGEITYVTDGDTLWVRPESGEKPRKLRLDGIDAPEICQAYGSEARNALRKRVLHRQVTVSTKAIDDYQRLIVSVRLEGEDLGAWMVGQGHAWSYRYRRDPGPYMTEEGRAREARLGLFADGDPQQPREFRKRHGSCYLPRH
jgi:endonuclease YncB( thermonuclease family)